jgi:hypothetical protein
MTAIRKIVDAHALAELFDLPPAFRNRRLEVVLLPADDDPPQTPGNGFKRFSVAQVEQWANAPEVQALTGALKGTGLPADLTIQDIREMRLAERYGT